MKRNRHDAIQLVLFPGTGVEHADAVWAEYQSTTQQVTDDLAKGNWHDARRKWAEYKQKQMDQADR